MPYQFRYLYRTRPITLPKWALDVRFNPGLMFLLYSPSPSITIPVLPANRNRLRRVAWYLNVWGMLLLLLGVLPYYHSYRLLASTGG